MPIILLGTLLTVTSLKFEMRHMFYLYIFPLVAWGAVAWSLAREARLLLAATIHGGPVAMNVLRAKCREAAPFARSVAVILVVVAAGSFFALETARVYQVKILRMLVADWVARPRIPALYEVSEIPPGAVDIRTLPPGMSRIRILSPMPLSAGVMRPVDAPVKEQVEMGVVAMEFDGQRCRGRAVALAAIGGSTAPKWRTRFLLNESFNVRIRDETDYIVTLPAFYYSIDKRVADMFFSGIEIRTEDVACIKSVELVAAFRKSDVLFDFFVPKSSATLKSRDLFQRVYIPGLGYL